MLLTNGGVKLKCLQKLEQNTLILRDIPSDTPVEAVSQIFSRLSECPVPVSVRSDVADTWFVAFSSESDARSALQATRESKFDGKPVRCRLKTESVAKSYFRYAFIESRFIRINSQW